ncbi:MAG: hypothetical protein V3S68_04885 [Dehalococcoidia bacterium]
MSRYYGDPGDPTVIKVDQAFPPKSSAYEVGFPVVLKIPLDALAAANDIVSIENPFGVETVIIEATVHVKVAGGSSSAVLDVDIVANSTATGDDIFDGVDANAEGIVSMVEAGAGSNAEHTGQIWNKAGGTNDFVNTKLLVANAANLEADLYLVCMPCNK